MAATLSGLGMQNYNSLPVYDTSGRKIGTVGSVRAKPNEKPAPAYAGNPTTTFSAINALDQLLKTLAEGGTPEQQFMTKARSEEVGRARKQQEGFSKDAAMSDSQALIDKAISDAMRAANPRITAYSEGAGSSKSSMAALLTQEAALKGAVEGAAAGTQLATAYGQLSNQLEGILADLTKQDPNSPVSQLLQAVIGSKGIIESVRPIAASSSGSRTQPAAAASAPLPELAKPNPFINSNPYAGVGYSATPALPAQPTVGSGGGIIVRHEPEADVAETVLSEVDYQAYPYTGMEAEY